MFRQPQRSQTSTSAQCGKNKNKDSFAFYFVAFDSIIFRLIILGEWIDAVNLSLKFVTQLRRSSELVIVA